MVNIRLKSGTLISHAFVEDIKDNNVKVLVTTKKSSLYRSYSLDNIEEIHDMDTGDSLDLTAKDSDE